MKLNPAKCAFGVTFSKFLRFMISHRGIEANLKKIQAIRQIGAPKIMKEMQRLTRRIAALNQFVSKLARRCLPFFQTLRKLKDFQWTGECWREFEELKAYLGTPPVLSKPKPGELYLYLTVSPSFVGSMLTREENQIQKPVYYVSRVLQNAKTRYPWLEKLIFTLIIFARKFRPYWQAHTMVVLTDQSLRTALNKLNATGRMAKWALKITEFDIMFQP